MRHSPWWLDVMSGDARGPWATGVRVALAAASAPYRLAVDVRNRMFDLGWRHVQRVGVPVISVGNLTVGGTGKSPCVRWLAAHLQRIGKQPAILSRGYGAIGDAANDEAMELSRRLPDVPHLQSPDRVAIAEQAVDEFHADVLVLDDGFQHRRLHRDLDFVLVDATRPWGFDRLLPRGLLREPIGSLRRADAVIITRADQAPAAQVDDIRHRASSLTPQAVVAGAAETALHWVNATGTTNPLTAIPSPVLPFCGIGNPPAFAATLANSAVPAQALVTFPDHHRYTANDLRQLARQAKEQGAMALVCTEKDLVKIDAEALDDVPLWALRIDWRWEWGEQQIVEQLQECVSAKR